MLQGVQSGFRTPPEHLPLLSLLLQKATALPAQRAEYFDGSEPVQNRVYKSLKVWSMLADLEESLGTFQVSPWNGVGGIAPCSGVPGMGWGNGKRSLGRGRGLTPPPGYAALSPLRSPPRQCMTASWTCASPRLRSSLTTLCSWRSTSTLRRASRYGGPHPGVRDTVFVCSGHPTRWGLNHPLGGLTHRGAFFSSWRPEV